MPAVDDPHVVHGSIFEQPCDCMCIVRFREIVSSNVCEISFGGMWRRWRRFYGVLLYLFCTPIILPTMRLWGASWEAAFGGMWGRGFGVGSWEEEGFLGGVWGLEEVCLDLGLAFAQVMAWFLGRALLSTVVVRCGRQEGWAFRDCVTP